MRQRKILHFRSSKNYYFLCCPLPGALTRPRSAALTLF